MSNIILKDITKIYGESIALIDINLTFLENKIYALLGRNGAGKSTMLNIISNRVVPNCGEVFWGDVPLRENDEAQSNIYCMSEAAMFQGSLKFEKVLEISKTFYPNLDIEYAENLCRLFDLDKKKRLSSFSTGYTSIYKIILALSSGAAAVFLDEPILGLDANHRELFYQELLSRYMEKPATYIISTHLIEEAAKFVERAVIIKEGRIIADETVDDLTKNIYVISGTKGDVDEYVSDKEIFGESSMGGLKSVYIKGSLPNNIPSRLEASKPELQQLFIKMTQ